MVNMVHTDHLKLRVHISPVGFEFDRIVLPLLNLRADKVWLISARHGDMAQAYRDKITHELSKRNIEFEFASCDITDLYDVLKSLREIIETEKGNDIFINVSSGTKIEAIAGMMASMIFKNGSTLSTYYVEPEKYLTERENVEPISKGIKKIAFLPDYRIEKPKQQLIALLKLIDRRGGVITKKDLIEEATNAKLIVVGGRNQKQSKYMSLNKNFLDPLSMWKLVRVSKEGRKKEVTLTTEGKNMLLFLG